MKLIVCSNCVLDSSEPNISFDENGVCRYCNDYFELNNFAKNQLSESEKSLKLNKDIIQIKKDVYKNAKEDLFKYEIILGKEFYGFTNEKEFKFLKY
jgi:hypothetical protein